MRGPSPGREGGVGEMPRSGAHLAGEVVEDVAALAVEDGDGLGEVMPLREKPGPWEQAGCGQGCCHTAGAPGSWAGGGLGGDTPYLHDGAL